MATTTALPTIKLTIESSQMPTGEDFTIFLDSHSAVENFENRSFGEYFERSGKSSWSDLARLETSCGQIFTGRVTLTKTLYTDLLSLSFRKKHAQPTTDLLKQAKKEKEMEKEEMEKEEKEENKKRKKLSSPQFLFQTEQYVETIAQYIEPKGTSGDRLDGAIVIAGATSCGKTRVAEHLIKRLLLNHHNDARHPHLVTLEKGFEGPITTPSWSSDNIIVPPNNSTCTVETLFPNRNKVVEINYTPRQIPTCCGNLKDGLADALRQTPALVYLGELRDDEDMLEMDRFSGTGHLVLATIHAGSLQEAILRYIRAAKEKHFAANSNESIMQIASRLRAVIHLEKYSIQTETNSAEATFISMWYRQGASSARAIRCLVETGVPLPYACDGNGTIGRYGFLKSLGNIPRTDGEQNPTKAELGKYKKEARKRDLERGI